MTLSRHLASSGLFLGMPLFVVLFLGGPFHVGHLLVKLETAVLWLESVSATVGGCLVSKKDPSVFFGLFWAWAYHLGF